MFILHNVPKVLNMMWWFDSTPLSHYNLILLLLLPCSCFFSTDASFFLIPHAYSHLCILRLYPSCSTMCHNSGYWITFCRLDVWNTMSVCKTIITQYLYIWGRNRSKRLTHKNTRTFGCIMKWFWSAIY